MAPIKFNRRKKKSRELENLLTPIEIAELIKAGDAAALPFVIRSLLDAGETPVGYVREDRGKNAKLYTANRGARSLVVAFCGKGGMGVPVSSFLQVMREDLYDILVLHDEREMFFDRGVAGFSDSFLETAQRIKAVATERGYGEIITFGPSMGGYPALRTGLLLGADRAISVGGMYCWHVGRLLQNRETTMAFDVLCPCFSGRNTELVAVASADHPIDSGDLKVLQRNFPNCHGSLVDTGEHNIMLYFHQARLLRLFCACLFEYWQADIRSDLFALVGKTAQNRCDVEIDRAKRLSHELEAVYGSASWRLTRPLRSLADNLKRLRRGLFAGRDERRQTQATASASMRSMSSSDRPK